MLVKQKENKMNTEIKNNKMALGLRDDNKLYMIKYDIKAEVPLRIQVLDHNENEKVLEFKTIRDAALFLKDNNFTGFQSVNYEECPQMLVNTFNNKGMVL